MERDFDVSTRHILSRDREFLYEFNRSHFMLFLHSI